MISVSLLPKWPPGHIAILVREKVEKLSRIAGPATVCVLQLFYLRCETNTQHHSLLHFVLWLMDVVLLLDAVTFFLGGSQGIRPTQQ